MSTKSAEEQAQAAGTQEVKDTQQAQADAGGREAVASAPAAETPKPAVAGGEVAPNLSKHPVEVAKGKAREGAAEHIEATRGDETNLTATQKNAMVDQEREMEAEEAAAPEPARGVEHSVGTERKYGLRTAAPASEIKEAQKASASAKSAKAKPAPKPTAADRANIQRESGAKPGAKSAKTAAK
jgi:hypothetical protein